MKLIKVGDGVHINPDCVVRVTEDRKYLRVELSSGEVLVLDLSVSNKKLFGLK
jgi:hypothetical protein